MRKLPILEQLRVATPCAAEWAAMTGNDEARHCAHCNQNVYNLSALTRAQADELVRTKDARLCMRYFHLADGTMLLRDGAVAYRPTRLVAAGLAALALTGAGLALRQSATDEIVYATGGQPPAVDPVPAVAPPPTVPVRRELEAVGQGIAIDREVYVTGGAAPIVAEPPAPHPHAKVRHKLGR